MSMGTPGSGAPRMPRLGLGTWRMGESRARRAEEVAALRAGIDLGMTLIDTAEMYGQGGAEDVVGEAIRGRRDEVYVVSKFYPHHASRRELVAACEASLGRLGIERLDCYLYHWRGPVPLAETVAALGELVRSGRIARWGVSNFDVDDLEELQALAGGSAVAANQVLYHLGERGVEFALLPLCERRSIEVMAYSPLAEGRLARDPALVRIAARIGSPPAEVALAWLLRNPNVVVIPKAASVEHLRSNRRAAELTLDRETLEALDRAFPPPRRKTALAMV
jgi:diketogulonate reductase-like aldo/keto reductase